MQITITSCPNFRDMGGLPLEGGGETVGGRIFRSDCLSKLTEADILQMEAHNIRTVLDLRFPDELAKRPNPLEGRAGFFYSNVSLADGIHSSGINLFLPESMGGLYTALIEDSAQDILQAFRRMIQGRRAGQGIVFHCAAGKDRTGVIAALLLLANGVGREAVIRDYACSYDNMKEIFEKDKERLRSESAKIPEYIFLSDRAFMEEFLDYLEAHYQTADGYFEQKGLTEEERRAVAGLLR